SQLAALLSSLDSDFGETSSCASLASGLVGRRTWLSALPPLAPGLACWSYSPWLLSGAACGRVFAAEADPKDPGGRGRDGWVFPEALWQRPTVFVTILARIAAHTLPHFLGCLERLDYPKDRMAICLRYVTQNWTSHAQLLVSKRRLSLKGEQFFCLFPRRKEL
uniref:Uncharacterized protein n=1 Tax=Monodelphis domestica TaxID=13616 RepID=A0A5F8H9D7_MONDO